MNDYDVAVIGAGIVGLSSAYHIKRTNPDLKMVVIDKAGSYAQGNTARSAAGFRDLFSSDINFKLSSSSVDFYRHIHTELGYNLGMKYTGYMFLLNEDTSKMEVLNDLSRKTKTRFLEKDEISKEKYLNTVPNPDEAAVLGLKNIESAFIGENCGIIEPDLLAGFYYRELVSMGVEFRFNHNVLALSLEAVDKMDFPGEPFLWQEKSIGKLITNKGDITADRYVIATDIWTTHLLDPVGIDSHVRPKKRQVFQASGEQISDMVLNSDLNDEGIFPFTVLPAHGIYLRPAPKEKSFWIGVADDIGRDFSYQEEPEADKKYYEYNIIGTVNAYISAFSNSRLTGMWAGYYSYNTIDMNPYVFSSMNLIIVTGTSGSGILKGDSIGRVVSALYNGEEDTKLYNGRSMKTEDLGIKNRKVDKEMFVL